MFLAMIRNRFRLLMDSHTLKALSIRIIVVLCAVQCTACAELSAQSMVFSHSVNDEHNATMGSQIRQREQISAVQRAEDDRLAPPSPVVLGMDVSSYQGAINWPLAYQSAARFAYIKATEGNYYQNSIFAAQYDGAYRAGFIRGAYHFANPHVSSGAEQAAYFLAHGGGWSGDGKTLPGALDLEYNPYGADCYGLSATELSQWIQDFVRYYQNKTSQYPLIYTSHSWWSKCVDPTLSLSATVPLWIARYSSNPGRLPYSWQIWTLWQNNDSGILPGDQDQFNGPYTQLQKLAAGS